MKRINFTIFLLLSSMSMMGQQVSGDFSKLKAQSSAVVEISYSEASIHGLSDEEFGEIEKDWEKDKPTIKAKLISELSDGIHGKLAIGGKKENKYKIVVNVLSVNSKGTHISDVVIVSPSGEVEASIKRLEGKGGTFGTALNLIGDGARSTGKKLARIISTQFKKIKD